MARAQGTYQYLSGFDLEGLSFVARIASHMSGSVTGAGMETLYLGLLTLF